jgi:hypothetical protein
MLNYSQKMKISLSRLLIIFSFFFLSPAYILSQSSDSTKIPFHFGGAVTATNNGISFIPSFTLGKPAVIFDLTTGRKLSFEPQFRFSMEGKPWSILFWFRYPLIEKPKFRLNIGAHPALSFKETFFIVDSSKLNTIIVHRYIAVELVPSYFFTKNISFGTYLFYSRSLENDVARNTVMLSLRGTLSNIRITEKYSLRFTPQVYYLKMDSRTGYFLSATLTASGKNCPFTLSSIINDPLKSDILGGQKFLWNISLTYNFRKEYKDK